MKKILHFLLPVILLSTSAFQSSAQSDTPCSAPLLSVNVDSCVFITGTTVGATYQNNAANGGTPPCASPGSPDVWFAFIVPPSGAVTITTIAGTITDGGMAVYSGPCTNPHLIDCDDDDAAGFMPVIDRSDFIPGDTVFIRFWKGWSTGTGTFGLCLIRSHSDCRVASKVCGQFHAPQNAYGNGSHLELVGTGPQCGNPEFQSHWLKFKLATSGTINFKILPDSIGPGVYPDYDWVLFQSNAPNFCLTYDSASTLPVCCNASSSQGPGGSTGMDATGVSCSVPPGTGNPFCPPIAGVTGDTYYLLINNFSTSSSGFDLTFSGTTATFDCNFTTGTNEAIATNDAFATIFPNPFNESTNIRFQATALPPDLKFELFNALGQSVLMKADFQNTETTINCAALKAGMYMYKFYTAEKLYQSGKLSIIK